MTSLLRLALCVAALIPASVANADELWRQDPVNAAGGASSQDARNAGGLGWFSEVADNFTLSGAQTIQSLEFWGGYAATEPGHTQGFTIRFYADGGAAPGALLSEQDVAAFSETVYYNLPSLNWNGYHYTLNLPTPVSLSAAGTYWISIVAILDRGNGSPEPQWGWVQAASGTAPSAVQWFFSATHSFTALGHDMGFVLIGGNGGTGGVCCRGATCTTALTTANDCAASLPGGLRAGSAFATGASCNAAGSTSIPCCYADYNKSGSLSAQDIFDYLNDWFAQSPLARTGSDGSAGTLAAQNIFDFLNAWFAGC